MQQVSNFNIQDILPFALVVVVAGIGIGYGLNVLGDVKDDVAECATGQTYNTTNGFCYNATAGNYAPFGDAYTGVNQSIEGVAKLPEKLPLIATVIVAAIIIGILVRYLLIRFN